MGHLKVLRTIRTGSLILIFLLGGIYAGTYVWVERSKPAPPQSITETTTVADRLPEFSLADLRGETRAISEWSGRPLVVNFWATWCAPCRREMPLLETLHKERAASELAVIGIAIDRLDAVTAFITESGITYPILVGEQDAMEAAELFGADFVALPFTVFTAPDGQILLLHSGELHRDDLREILAISDQVAAGDLTVDEARQLLKPGPGHSGHPSTG